MDPVTPGFRNAMWPQDRRPDISLFVGLADADRSKLIAEFEQRMLARGETLMCEGDVADHLFIVVSGRFVVTRSGRAAPLNEIGVGETIGEIAFFAGGERTATVTALRDSIVLCLARIDYETLAAKVPAVPAAVTAMLARRLAETSAGRPMMPDPRPRTVAILRAGVAPLTSVHIDRLVDAFAALGPTTVVDGAAARVLIPEGATFASPVATQCLNALEDRSATVLYIADAEPTEWSLKALRHADLALLVGAFEGDAGLNALERAAASILTPAQIRLVLLHPTRREITGTARWLAGRHVAMHHHVALDASEDLARVLRFLGGTAQGLVAGGGGAFCMAHVGLYKALVEAGYTFDIMAGTSGGSAMTAAFAAGATPDEIDAAIELAFVAHKAMRRYTIPRYGLIDHTHYDRELAALFGERRIEDLWIPFFCVSTNLSENRVEVHRAGLVWQAVRASSSIPVLLPPFYTPAGDMLVDGGLIDNVPVKAMRDLKSGPNVVMSLEAPKLQRFPVDYERLPSRGDMLRALVNPFSKSRLPVAPGIGTVLLRALVAHRQDYERFLTTDDLHLKPPLPDDMGLLDWHRHRELLDGAYAWCRDQLARTDDSRTTVHTDA